MPQPFTAAPHDDVLALLIQLAILLFTARVFGEIAQRLKQPTVVGEILAGIVLGPSLLSGLFPAFGAVMIPQNAAQGYLLETVSLIGVLLLLLVTGLETDLALIRRQARSALGIALGGLLLPLLMGFLLGLVVPDALLVAPEQRTVFALFLATAMAISAIPVIAKVLMDLSLTRRNIGQAIIAAAMIDDTTGWIILSVVIGLAGGGLITLGSVGQSVFSVLAFIGLSFFAGRWVIRRALNFVQNQMQGRDKTLALVLLCMFVWAAIGQALHLEALLGAFVVGLIFSQMPRLPVDVVHRIESFTLGVFAPIFFGVAGLKVDARALLQPDLLFFTLIVIGVATFCKVVGVYVGARAIGGSDHWTAVFYGAGLNARGSMGIIVASIGLSVGVLSQPMFSMIVVMAVLTSLMAPAVMRYALNHIQPDEQELARLRQEAQARDSLIANVHRALVPVRARLGSDEFSGAQMVEARVLERLGAGRRLALTLLTVAGSEADRPAAQTFLGQLASLFNRHELTRKVLVSDTPSDAILDEARRDYDLLVIGATESQPNSEVLFTPIVDTLARLAPCPVLIVHGRGIPADWTPRRILVPTNGSLAARRAAEVAFALAAGGSGGVDGEVMVLRVVEESTASYRLDSSGMLVARQLNVAHRSVEALRALGADAGVPTSAEVRVGDEPETMILNLARTDSIDLIVLGTSVSAGSERLYLGPRVERIVNNAPCPVIIVNS